MSGWIVIPNWDRFQHYTDRDPPWIKLYVNLNSKPEWCELSTAARGMLTTIWMEYARSSGHLPRGKVLQLCGKSARSAHLESLIHAGFVEVSASRPLALARSREKNVPTERKKTRVKTKKTTGWRQVHGSHGMTMVPDPFGTDPAPKDAAPL